MRTTGIKGTISALIAAAAIMLAVFSINSALNIQDYNETTTKMLAAHETSLRAENAMQILDKAASKTIYGNLESSTCAPDTAALTSAAVKSEFDETLTEYNTGNTITCVTAAAHPTVTQTGNIVSIEGTFTCTTTLNGLVFSDTRNYSFLKESISVTTPTGPSCKVKDSISLCTEWQGNRPMFDAANC